MKLKKHILMLLFLNVFILVYTAYGEEINGWIKGDACWVVKTPSIKAKIIGIILKKAAVTVEDAGDNWLKIIYAPTRDPLTGKWIECKGCYIDKKDFTTKSPVYW